MADLEAVGAFEPGAGRGDVEQEAAETLPVAEGAPRVTFSEALAFLKLRPAAAARSDEFPSWQEEADSKSEAEMAEFRGRMVDKLERMRALDDEDRLAKGWTRDGEEWVPPGWTRS